MNKKYTIKENFNNVDNSIINKSEGKAKNYFNNADKLNSSSQHERTSNYEIDYWKQCRLSTKQKEYKLYAGENSLKRSNLYFDANDEMDKNQLQFILNKIKFNIVYGIDTKKLETIKEVKYNLWNNRQISRLNLQNYKKIQKMILFLINNQINEDRLFQNINDILIQYKINKSKQLERYMFTMDIYRYMKFHGFHILVNCVYDISKNKIIILNLKSKSIIVQGDFYLHKGISNNKLDTYLNINNQSQAYNNIENTSIDLKLPSKNQMNQISDKKLKNIIYDFLKDAYTCYGSEGNDYYNCKAKKGITGQYKKIGFWDRPCLQDQECPFYKANKNYDNNRGGCIEGVCEMPINVKLVSPRQFLPNTPPYCHNCDKSDNIGDCCNQQMKYNSKMKSPDYAFDGDLKDRLEKR